MDDRRKIAHELDDMQQMLKELEIRYEKYFAGIERREPSFDRNNLSRRIRHFVNRHIVWTDLQFRYQGIASRFMSYCQYWDRILRLMDEGKYHRHTAKLQRSLATTDETTASKANEADQLHEQMRQARKNCGMSGDGPAPGKIASFLNEQREKIRSRYGDKPVEFNVEVHEGKPRIKARFKN